MATPPIGKEVGHFEIIGMAWYSPGVHQIGGKWIITHHEKARPPLDAKRLKASRYFSMVEKESEASK